MANRKPLAVIFQDDNGWRIKTKAINGRDDVWMDTFQDEEEATTYALRDGCRVEGC